MAALPPQRRIGPRAVDADSPIGFGPAEGGQAEQPIVLVGLHLSPCVPYSLVGLCVQPKSLGGTLPREAPEDVVDDQLTFPVGVAGMHDQVGAFESFRDVFEAVDHTAVGRCAAFALALVGPWCPLQPIWQAG